MAPSMARLAGPGRTGEVSSTTGMRVKSPLVFYQGAVGFLGPEWFAVRAPGISDPEHIEILGLQFLGFFLEASCVRRPIP